MQHYNPPMCFLVLLWWEVVGCVSFKCHLWGYRLFYSKCFKRLVSSYNVSDAGHYILTVGRWHSEQMACMWSIVRSTVQWIVDHTDFPTMQCIKEMLKLPLAGERLDQKLEILRIIFKTTYVVSSSKVCFTHCYLYLYFPNPTSRRDGWPGTPSHCAI